MRIHVSLTQISETSSSLKPLHLKPAPPWETINGHIQCCIQSASYFIIIVTRIQTRVMCGDIKSKFYSCNLFLFPENSLGLCHVLARPCPKPRPQIWDLSPDLRDQWEIDRSEVQLLRKLGHGNFGEVWYGEYH